MAKPKQDLSHEAQAPGAGPGGTESLASEWRQRGTARLRADSDSASFRRSITLQLDADRSPKWETVTEKNREIWREILSHSKTVEALGLAPVAGAAAPGPPVHCLPESAAAAFYNGLARLEALVCSRAFKVDFAEAARLLAFTDAEKEQLIPVTQALVDKHLPVAAEKYGAEFSLAFLLFSMTAQKIEAVRALAPRSGETAAAVEAAEVFERKETVQ